MQLASLSIFLQSCAAVDNISDASASRGPFTIAASSWYRINILGPDVDVAEWPGRALSDRYNPEMARSLATADDIYCTSPR